MAKLGDELRASYEKQQAGLGDVGDARHRLMQNALTAPARESHRLQWVAAIAAVLIAALVITTFALVRGSIRPQPVPGASPRANASPTPLHNEISVPDSTPLIIYGDPVKTNQLDAVSWDGKSWGKLADQQLVGVSNPQANLFATESSVVDRSGRVVMTGTFGAKGFMGMWADDGHHFCQVVPFDNPGATGVPTTLRLVTVGGSTRDVARIGTLYNQTFVRVAACSTHSDRAVVVQSGGQGLGTAQLWVVRLSTGAIIWTQAFDTPAVNISVIASRDGTYVAWNRIQSGPSHSTVYGPDGRQITQLASWIGAFSWDGSLAVVEGGSGSTTVDIVSWRDGAVRWTGPPGVALVKADAQPDGSAMALWLMPTGSPQQQVQRPDLYVLSAGGATVAHVSRAGLLLP